MGGNVYPRPATLHFHSVAQRRNPLFLNPPPTFGCPFLHFHSIAQRRNLLSLNPPPTFGCPFLHFHSAAERRNPLFPNPPPTFGCPFLHFHSVAQRRNPLFSGHTHPKVAPTLVNPTSVKIPRIPPETKMFFPFPNWRFSSTHSATIEVGQKNSRLTFRRGRRVLEFDDEYVGHQHQSAKGAFYTSLGQSQVWMQPKTQRAEGPPLG